jgi:hypothetical protein
MRRPTVAERERGFEALKAERDKAALREAYRRTVIDLQTKSAELSLAARLIADQWREMGGR